MWIRSTILVGRDDGGHGHGPVRGVDIQLTAFGISPRSCQNAWVENVGGIWTYSCSHHDYFFQCTVTLAGLEHGVLIITACGGRVKVLIFG